LGATLVWLGKYAEGHLLLEESVPIYNDLGFHRNLAFPSVMLGTAKVHLGRYAQARSQGHRSLALSRKLGNRRETGHSLRLLGSVALAGKAYAEAQELLQESDVVYREIGQRHGLSMTLVVLGYAARARGQLFQAREHLCEALRTATGIWAVIPLVEVLPVMALLLADRGETERAVELYALASRYPFVANSRWFEDVAGRYIAAIAATLPPDVVAAAQERGRARDLEATILELVAELEGQ
jgi:tetratricopeptide (TPR) repeat protein